MKSMEKKKDLKFGKTIPNFYKTVLPEEKYLLDKNNPPNVKINFLIIIII